MSKTTVQYIQATAVITAVAAVVHYLTGLEWPWAILIGASASILLRVVLRHPRTPPPATGGRT
jgi:hypothetical protein